jgi:hypothetical protein
MAATVELEKEELAIVPWLAPDWMAMAWPAVLVNLRLAIETLLPVTVKTAPEESWLALRMAVGVLRDGPARVRLLALTWGKAVVGT